MKNDDTKLIQRVLAGDDNAFSMLVGKYQKQVHALAWRKIGDFQYRRGNYTGYFPESIQETRNTEETAAFCELALCHCRKPMQFVAP